MFFTFSNLVYFWTSVLCTRFYVLCNTFGVLDIPGGINPELLSVLNSSIEQKKICIRNKKIYVYEKFCTKKAWILKPRADHISEILKSLIESDIGKRVGWMKIYVTHRTLNSNTPLHLIVNMRNNALHHVVQKLSKKTGNFCQKLKSWWKIEMLGRKAQIWPEMEILVKFGIYGQKSKFWSNVKILGQKS